MKKRVKEVVFKKILCMSLAAGLIAVGMPATVFAAEDEISGIGLSDNAVEEVLYDQASGQLPSAPSFAETPPPISDSYKIKETNYYKVDTEPFTVSQLKFFKSYLEAQNGDTSSVGDWNIIAQGLWFSAEGKHAGWNEDFLKVMQTLDDMPNKNTDRDYPNVELPYDIKSGSSGPSADSEDAEPETGESEIEPDGGFGGSKKQVAGFTGLKSAYSMKEVENKILKLISEDNPDLPDGVHYDNAQARIGMFQEDTGESVVEGPLLYNAYYAADSNRSETKHRKEGAICAVVFSDFKVSPLIPDQSTGAYVTTKTMDVSEDETYASRMINSTEEETEFSQSLTNTQTGTVSSEINGSKQYEYGASIMVGSEPEFPGVGSVFKTEITLSASTAISKGWSQSEECSDEKSATREVTKVLPPYTGVMISQTTKTQQNVMQYNCPVAVSYRVRVLAYSFDGWGRDEDERESRILADFKLNSQEDLKQRALVEPEHDRENIKWDLVQSEIFNPKGAKAIDSLAHNVPVTSTDAEFRDTLKTVECEAKNLMPILPLSSVSMVNQDVEVTMKRKDTMRVDTIELNGLNAKNTPYYGFNPDFGEWALTDAKGNIVKSSSVAGLKEDETTGKLTLTALSPGTVYLKYFIDEDKYGTMDNPRKYAKNDELKKTAFIKVIVKQNYSIKNDEVDLSASAFTYNGKVQKPTIKTIGGMKLKEGKDYTAKWSNAKSKDAGTYTVTITGKGKYKGKTKAEYIIDKADNSLSVKARKSTHSLKASKLKKKARTINGSKIYKITKKGQGDITYSLSSAIKGSKDFTKKFSVNSKTGTLKAKKGLKKGTYNVALNVNADGDKNHNSGSKSINIKVKVK